MAEQVADGRHQRLQQGLRQRRSAEQAQAASRRADVTNQEGESEQQQTKSALLALWATMQAQGRLRDSFSS